MTDAAQRLAQARQRLAAAGQSPRRVGKDRALAALDWVYRWGWSTPAVIDALTGAKRRGLCAKLVQAGLLVETKTAAGRILHDLPQKIVTLSDAGLAEVERRRVDDLMDYSTNPYKVNQAMLRHDLLVQKATQRSLQSGGIKGFLTPRELARKSTADSKQADALWIMPDSRRAGVEVELTAKWDRRLDEFVWRIWQSMTEQNRAMDLCIISSDSPAIIARYKKAFAAGQTVHTWRKDQQSKWHIDRAYTVPDWLPDRMRWVQLKD